MSAVARVLEAELASGLFTKGAQVTALVRGEPLVDLAVGEDGTGRPMTASSVFRVYCTIKPVTAVAVAQAVDAGLLDLDEPLAERLPGIAAVGDGAVRLRHVLHHTAGLQRPTALEVELLPPGRRSGHLAAAPRAPGWPVGRRAAYSELLAWHLLGRLLEVVTGETLRSHLRRSLLDPLGLTSTWVGMTPEEHARVLPRLGVNVDMSTNAAFPMVLERGQRLCTDVNPAHGGYTTSSDLARFYDHLLDRLAGAGDPALPGAGTLARFTSRAGPSRFDEVLDRDCEYGLGFMTGLAGHAFGRWCSAASFGHSGNVGSSFAFADPERGLAVGVIFNGLVDHQSAFVRRPALVRAIYEDLEAAVPPPVTTAAEVVDPQSRPWRHRRRRKAEAADGPT